MSNEETFEHLFTTFDEVVEQSEPPILPADPGLTRNRTPSLWSRWLRWSFQGGGLLALFLALYLGAISEQREFPGNLIGLTAIVFLLSPLLGQRPLAQPRRWLFVTLTAIVLSLPVVSLLRWPNLIAESNDAAVSVLIASACSVLQQATSFPVLLWGIVLMWGLFGACRFFAHSYPWLETRAARHSWRKIVSLTFLGLVVGAFCAGLLGHRALWRQTWITDSVPGPWLASDSVPYSRHGDLSWLIFAQRGQDDWSLDYNAVKKLSGAKLHAVTVQALDYLQQDPHLTISDRLLLIWLMRRALDEPVDSTSSDFLWEAYCVAYHSELTTGSYFLATEVLRQRLLPELCESNTTPELLTLWQRRSDRLEVIKPVSKEAMDAFFLERLSDYEPGALYSPTHHAAYRQPLKLFGVATRWTPAQLAAEAERSLALLVYSHRRTQVERPGFLREHALLPPYTHHDLIDHRLNRLFGSVSNLLHDRNQLLDQALLYLIVDLKKERLENGHYPQTVPGLPDSLSYQSSGTTAQLHSNPTDQRSSLYFSGQLR